MRPPTGDLVWRPGDGTSKSVVSRRFVGLSRKKLWEWFSSDHSGLDQLVTQIDGITVGNHVLVAAVGVDDARGKRTLAWSKGRHRGRGGGRERGRGPGALG